MLPHSGKIRKLISKNINNNYKSRLIFNYKAQKKRFNMNAMQIIKYSSTVMEGKRKLYECHTRFFHLCSVPHPFEININTSKLSHKLHLFFQKNIINISVSDIDYICVYIHIYALKIVK